MHSEHGLGTLMLDWEKPHLSLFNVRPDSWILATTISRRLSFSSGI